MEVVLNPSSFVFPLLRCPPIFFSLCLLTLSAMADVVQYRLERMVTELDDLHTRGLFTRAEIADIVKHRRKFEFRLKRPSPLKHDYLAYIEYETQLDSLRRLRKKAVAPQMKKQGNKKMRKSVSDFAAVSRIIDIYRLAVTRFRGDIDLWFRYLEFCRQRKNGRMKKVLAELIRFHPKFPGVWIYAAAWEFDHNTNVESARSLMLSGLRVCPNSEDLWIEYLRMELTYLNKLKARKVALGEDKGSLIRNGSVAEEKQWRDENKDLFLSLGEDKENNDGSSFETAETETNVDLFQKQGLSILQTIYSGAVKAIPFSLGLRKKLLEILEATELDHSKEMRDEILQDMKRDFSTVPEYWDWLARRKVHTAATEGEGEEIMFSHIEEAIQGYEEALKFVPSSGMFDHYVKFLMDIVPSQNEAAPDSRLLSNASRLLKVFEKAENMGCLTEDLACQYVSVYLQLGKTDEARTLAENFCSAKFSKSAKLWLLRATIEIGCISKKLTCSNKNDLQPIFKIFEDVLGKLCVSEAESLWQLALKFFTNESYYFDKLVDISLISLIKYGGSDEGFSLSSAVISIVLQRDGILRARELYKRFLSIPHPGRTAFRKCIELELNLACAGDKRSIAKARNLYESALSTHNKDVSLWRDYYMMEKKMGTSETASAVHWRARKTLKDASAIVS